MFSDVKESVWEGNCVGMYVHEYFDVRVDETYLLASLGKAARCKNTGSAAGTAMRSGTRLHIFYAPTSYILHAFPLLLPLTHVVQRGTTHPYLANKSNAEISKQEVRAYLSDAITYCHRTTYTCLATSVPRSSDT